MSDITCANCGRWIDPAHNTCGCSDVPDVEAAACTDVTPSLIHNSDPIPPRYRPEFIERMTKDIQNIVKWNLRLYKQRNGLK